MELLNNIDLAVSRIKAAEKEERMNLIKTYLSGQVDLSSNSGVQLLNRRALFVTALRENNLWP